MISAFVNTLNIETLNIEDGHDALASSEELRAFLTEHRLLDPHDEIVTTEAAARARRVREALRMLLLANHDDEPLDHTAIARLNAAAGDAALMLRFEEDGSSKLLPQASGPDGALGRLLAIVFSAMQHETWKRLKVCKRDRCRRAFYDHSKNHSSKWCSMAVCGNREKARAYRRRKRVSVIV